MRVRERAVVYGHGHRGRRVGWSRTAGDSRLGQRGLMGGDGWSWAPSRFGILTVDALGWTCFLMVRGDEEEVCFEIARPGTQFPSSVSLPGATMFHARFAYRPG
jgi:hypothetical protein